MIILADADKAFGKMRCPITLKTLSEILHAFRCFHYYAFVLFLTLVYFCTVGAQN